MFSFVQSGGQLFGTLVDEAETINGTINGNTVNATFRIPEGTGTFRFTFSGRLSRRLFGQKRVVFTAPGRRRVCIPVPFRAHTFNLRTRLNVALGSVVGAPRPRRGEAGTGHPADQARPVAGRGEEPAHAPDPPPAGGLRIARRPASIARTHGHGRSVAESPGGAL